MKKTTRFGRLAILAAAAALLISAAAVVSYAYDGTADPVISLSYLRKFKTTEVDPAIAELKNLLDAQNSKIDALSTQLSDAKLQISRLQSQITHSPTTPDTPAAPVTGAYGYDVVELTFGQTLLAGGACDVMLRSGEAIVIAPDANQGLADYTDGREVLSGEPIPVNHMLLIPRGDGRGIMVTTDVAFVMVRGAYTIQ